MGIDMVSQDEGDDGDREERKKILARPDPNKNEGRRTIRQLITATCTSISALLFTLDWDLDPDFDVDAGPGGWMWWHTTLHR